MEKENLYFIAIIPPAEIFDDITAFKQDFATHFESKKALKVVPHITLKVPFQLPVSGHSDLQQWFQKLYINSGPFQIELKNFGTFRNKDAPVVYVHPVMNTPLFSLQKELIRSFRNSYPELVNGMDLKFKPHMTIAYRDLKPDKFLEAWEKYKSKEYHAVFDVSSFHLLQHNGKMWNIIDTFHIQ